MSRSITTPKFLTCQQCLDILQKNVQQLLNHTIPLFDYYVVCDNSFQCIQIRGDDIIKSQATQLYIDTMITIYDKTKNTKSQMFIIFGCSFYKAHKYYLLKYEQSQEQKEYCDIEIKKGIIISLIGASSVLLLSL